MSAGRRRLTSDSLTTVQRFLDFGGNEYLESIDPQLGFVGDLIGFSLTEYLTEELLLKPILGNMGLSNCVGIASAAVQRDLDSAVRELTLGGISSCMEDIAGSDMDFNGNGRIDPIEIAPFGWFAMEDVNGKTGLEAIITGSKWLQPKGPSPPRICTSFRLLEFREEEGYTTP
eukprot:3891833-Prymnesium_polylepis.1